MDESITLRISGNGTSITSTYSPVINVNGGSEIALVCLKTSDNNFMKVSEKILVNESNNKITVLDRTQTDSFSLTIPHGTYTVNDISNYITKNSRDYFSLKLTDSRRKCKLQSNYIIDFRGKNSISNTLGFKNQLYDVLQSKDLYHESDIINFISIPVNSIKAMCNIAKGSFDNGKQSHSIYECFSRQSLGTELVESPVNLIYYKLKTAVIKKIKIDLVDEENIPIKNSNVQVTVVLHIRPIRS